MLKQYTHVDNENMKLIVGDTEDIKATYKSIKRNSEEIRPLYCGDPKFSDEKLMYGIQILPNMLYNTQRGYRMYVVTSDIILAELLHGYWK